MGAEEAKASSPQAPGSALRVQLFGGLNLRLGDAPVPPLQSGRAESLLAYLLLHRDAPQRRQHLAFLLWPDSTEPQARTNLRHVLHYLRRTLPDADRFIDVRPRTLQWNSQSPLWLDVAIFEQAVGEGRFQDAVETYIGELLEGSYDDWLLEERERLAQLYIHALERLVKELEERRHWPEAIRYAERLVRADPLQEEGYRQLMRLYGASGDRARGLAVYHLCATTLQRELGVEPAERTRAAYETLLQVPGGLKAPERDKASPSRPPLVGRTNEWSRLTTLWHAADRGSARLVLVTGEAGIGKTRLVDELRWWCAHAGAFTAEARAYPAEGAMAYGVVVAWLRSDAIARGLRRLDPLLLTELARLLPELLTEVPGLAAPEPLSQDEQRQRVFEAVAKAILAAGAPLLLVADDLQWCDPETLRLMHYLLRVEPKTRVLLAAAARREDMEPGHPVNDLIAGLQALGLISEIALERLSREQTGVLAGSIAGDQLDETVVERLYAHSEGNPLFIVEALRGDAATPAAEAGVGSRVQAIIASRLAQLSEPAAELVGVAATIGREFTAQLLADASRMADSAFVRGLDELWRRGLVRAHEPSTYDFSHDKIREVAYLALGPAQKRHYHLRVAQALQRTHAGDLTSLGAQIAAHYDAASAGIEAVRWYEQASEAAQRLHASSDAVRFLERALELVRGLPDGVQRDALELRLLTALPAPLVAVEGYLSQRVGQVHERALELAAAVGLEPAAPLIRSLALATLARGDFAAARPFGEQLRLRAEREGDDVLWVESAYVLGVAAFWQGELNEARAQFQAALERCRPEHLGAHLVRYGQDPAVFCGLRLAYTLWFLGREDESARARDAALSLAEQIGHPFTWVSTKAWAALLALDQHDEERLRHHVDGLASTIETVSKPTRLFAEALLGYVDVLDGRTQEGMSVVRRALDDARDGEPAAPGLLAMHMRIIVEACARAEDAETGLAAADEALVMGRGTQLWESEIRRLRTHFLAATGAGPGTVEAELERALQVAKRQGARSIEVRIRESLDHFLPETL